MKISPQVNCEKRQLQQPNVFSHVSYLLTFRESDDRMKFDQFKRSLTSKYIFLIAFIITTYYYGGGSASTFFYYPTAFSAFKMAFAFTFPIGVGMIVLLINAKDIFCRCDFLNKLSGWTCFVESVWLVGCSSSFALNMIGIGINGLCTNIRSSGCNYSGVDGRMPNDIVFAAAVLPICLSCAAKSASWQSVVLSFFIGLFGALFTVWYYNLRIWWSAMILFEVGCFVVMYEQQLQTVKVFLLTESQSVLVDQIEKMAEETHAKELRSMIANVAHDLKTPITALVNGLEYILTIVSDMSRNNASVHNTGGLNSGTSAKQAEMKENLNGLLETANNMRHVNSFLLMSINRCLDYTKASNGVTLVPHLQPARLVDLLTGPINCMKNLQDMVGITLLPISRDIQSRIVTDKQWFQENLLCLLSNAVKFSSEGTVTVGVNLVSSREMKEAGSQFTSMANTAGIGSRTMPLSPTSMMLRIEVEDTGQGIQESDLPWLFFACKQAQRTTGGTGLGLYSLSKRVEALGGCYGVLKRQDGRSGCNFWFGIPYRSEESVRSNLGLNEATVRSLGTSPSMCMDLSELSQFDTSGGLFTSFNKKILSRASTQTSKALTRNSTGLNESEVTEIEDSPFLQSLTVDKGVNMKEPMTTWRGGDLVSPKNALLSKALISPRPMGPVGPLHVLLVDDAISILKITGTMLRKLGHTVVTAENGAVALKLLLGAEGLNETGARYDVVLMDLQMPIMDGLQATRHLRAAEAEHNLKEECRSASNENSRLISFVKNNGVAYQVDGELDELEVMDIENQRENSVVKSSGGKKGGRMVHQKIIGVSACSDEETIQSAYDAGIDAFIAKPFNMTSFMDIYQSLLHKQ